MGVRPWMVFGFAMIARTVARVMNGLAMGVLYC